MECAALVRTEEPSANGLTYLQWADFDAGYSRKACFAEYHMTDVRVSSTWQTMFFVNEGCENCPTGEVSLTAGAACEACDEGKQPSNNRDSCESCEPGWYRGDAAEDDSCTWANDGWCDVPTYCQTGTDCTDCGTCGTNNILLCAECQAGLYQSASGRTYCDQCESGKYQSATAAAACISCGAGKSSWMTGSSAQSNCEDCWVGSYQDLVAQSTCKSCVAGKYESDSGSIACKDCEAGKYMEMASMPYCELCEQGKYSAATANDAATDCIACAVGKYSTAQPGTAETDCIACIAGRYVDVTGSDEPFDCIECAVGKYVDSAGSDEVGDCIDCAAGKYINVAGSAADTACIQCVVGRYVAVAGSVSFAACIECAAGKYIDVTGSDAESDCIECIAGKYLDVTGSDAASDCIACIAGKYVDATGSNVGTDCIDCVAGTYSATAANDDEDDCIACVVGKYSEEAGAAAASRCLGCQSGKSSVAEASDAASNCIECTAGWVQPSDGQSSCVACVPGLFVADSGGTLCLGCALGQYTPDSAKTECKECDAGFYQSSGGQTSCIACEPGFVSTEDGGLACVSCDDGGKPKADATACESCKNENSVNPSTDADYYSEYLAESDACGCPSTKEGAAYYDHLETWSRATGKEYTAESHPLPWQLNDNLVNGWTDMTITIDRSALMGTSVDESADAVTIFSSSYRSLTGATDAGVVTSSTSGNGNGAALDLNEVVLHNTNYLQCLKDGVQETGSRNALAAVLSKSMDLPSNNGVAKCINCASAAECIICCNGWYEQDNGTYAQPTNCSSADRNSAIAVPKAGWWRTSSDSPLLHRCPEPEACLGGHDTLCDTEKGYRQGSIMCVTCLDGFTSSDNRCYECPEAGLSALLIAASILFVVIVAVFLIRKNNASVHLPTADEVIQPGVTKAEQTTIAIRILMAFIQLTRLSTSFILPWPGVVETSAEVAAVVTDPGVATKAFPCFFSGQAQPCPFQL